MSDENTKLKTDEPVESLDKNDQKESITTPTDENTTNALEIADGVVEGNDQTNQDLNQTELDANKNNDETNVEEPATSATTTTETVEKEEEAPTTTIKKKRHDEKPKMDPSFFYDYESLIFQPVITEEAPFKTDFIQL